MISAKEESDVPIAPAMEGLLRVHKRIVDVDSVPANASFGASGIDCTSQHVALVGIYEGFLHHEETFGF
ncbi:hypothetical protein U1Q18_008966 [Sarracenia purpurea var. burkii]